VHLAEPLAVVAKALATSNPAAILAVFGASAARASTVLVLLALSAALAGGALAAGLRRASRHVPRVSGAVLLVAGGYLVAYWAPALRTGRPNVALASRVAPLSFAAGRLLGALALAALLVLALATAGAMWSRRQARADAGGRIGTLGADNHDVHDHDVGPDVAVGLGHCRCAMLPTRPIHRSTPKNPRPTLSTVAAALPTMCRTARCSCSHSQHPRI
jgi:hypothetical protein